MAYRTHNPDFNSLEKRLFEDVCRADPFFIFEFTKVIDGGKQRRKDTVEEDMSLFRSYFLSPQYYGKYTGECKSDVCMTLRLISYSDDMSKVKASGLLMDDFGIAMVNVYDIYLPKRTIPESRDNGRMVFSADYLKGFSAGKEVKIHVSGLQTRNPDTWHFNVKHDESDLVFHMFDNNYSKNISASMAEKLYIKNIDRYGMLTK
jgi:hypothetical protein